MALEPLRSRGREFQYHNPFVDYMSTQGKIDLSCTHFKLKGHRSVIILKALIGPFLSH